MVGWAFSLAMAGNFPALVMGVWWKRTTATGAICGIIAGFGLCLFYLVTTRYFPGAGVKYFGMTSLTNPLTGAPLVDIAKAMALPNAMESFPTLAHPMANKVGWFDLTNIACGLLGTPLGFAGHLRRQPARQGTVGGNAGLCRRYPQAAGQDGARGEDHLASADSISANGALRGPVLFSTTPASACRESRRLPLLATIMVLVTHPGSSIAEALQENRTLDIATSLATYWYFHLPNFILAALMYTMLGRVLLGLMVDADSPNYIWRFFCRITDPVIALIAMVTPKATPPAVLWLFGFVWLFWLRVVLHYTLLLLNLAPRLGGAAS